MLAAEMAFLAAPCSREPAELEPRLLWAAEREARPQHRVRGLSWGLSAKLGLDLQKGLSRDSFFNGAL